MFGGGPILIAEVGFAVSIQQMLSMRVVAMSMREEECDARASRGFQWPWSDEITAVLERRLVRLIGGEFTH